MKKTFFFKALRQFLLALLPFLLILLLTNYNVVFSYTYPQKAAGRPQQRFTYIGGSSDSTLAMLNSTSWCSRLDPCEGESGGERHILNQLHQLALGFGIAINISLSGLQTRMPRQLLDISHAPTDFRDFARRPRDKRPASGMTATTRHT